MASVAGSKGGIKSELKKELIMLRNKHVQEKKCSSRQQCNLPAKITSEEKCNE